MILDFLSFCQDQEPKNRRIKSEKEANPGNNHESGVGIVEALRRQSWKRS